MVVELTVQCPFRCVYHTGDGSWDMVWKVGCCSVFWVLMIFLGIASCVIRVEIEAFVSAMWVANRWIAVSWARDVSFCFASFLLLYASYP